MDTLITSGHFVRLDQLPEFGAQTPFFKVYAELYRRNKSGFVTFSPDGTRYYVKGASLAQAAVSAAGAEGSGATPAPPAVSLREVSVTAVGQVLNFAWAQGSVLRIPGESVDATADPEPLGRVPDMVFAVALEGRAVGWFLNHETVLGTATGKTVFVCENGHDNPDSDHGACYSCPGNIVRSERRT